MVVRMRIFRLALLIVCVAGLNAPAAAEKITITGEETWDGAEQHGIKPAGTGEEGDPFVYTIPEGMRIESGGLIRFDTNPTDSPNTEETLAPNVTLVFEKGDLHIESGGKIDVGLGGRNNDPATLTLEMGTNSITGNGEIFNSQMKKKSSPMNVVITSEKGGRHHVGRDQDQPQGRRPRRRFH